MASRELESRKCSDRRSRILDSLGKLPDAVIRVPQQDIAINLDELRMSRQPNPTALDLYELLRAQVPNPAAEALSHSA